MSDNYVVSLGRYGTISGDVETLPTEQNHWQQQ